MLQILGDRSACGGAGGGGLCTRHVFSQTPMFALTFKLSREFRGFLALLANDSSHQTHGVVQDLVHVYGGLLVDRGKRALANVNVS